MTRPHTTRDQGITLDTGIRDGSQQEPPMQKSTAASAAIPLRVSGQAAQLADSLTVTATGSLQTARHPEAVTLWASNGIGSEPDGECNCRLTSPTTCRHVPWIVILRSTMLKLRSLLQLQLQPCQLSPHLLHPGLCACRCHCSGKAHTAHTEIDCPRYRAGKAATERSQDTYGLSGAFVASFLGWNIKRYHT